MPEWSADPAAYDHRWPVEYSSPASPRTSAQAGGSGTAAVDDSVGRGPRERPFIGPYSMSGLTVQDAATLSCLGGVTPITSAFVPSRDSSPMTRDFYRIIAFYGLPVLVSHVLRLSTKSRKVNWFGRACWTPQRMTCHDRYF